ncbi:MAG: hypothetical protein KDE33_29715, partial [Bacteroidetes bacterium]|nr:hypothetical protein [Bacteroidota bacterium]
IEKNIFQKALSNTKESVSKAAGIAGQTTSNVKVTAVSAGSKVSGALGNVLRRTKDKGANTGADAATEN